MNLVTTARRALLPAVSPRTLGIGLLLMGIAGCGSGRSGAGDTSGNVGGNGAGGTVGGVGGSGTGGAGVGASGAGGTVGGVGGSGTGGAGVGGSDAGNCAPVIGTGLHCTAEGEACCVAQGGVLGDVCTSPLGCAGPNTAANCYPPLPPPANDEFSCEYFNCKVGQTCISPVVAGDGCWRHACAAPPAPCDVTPTCACLTQNNLLEPEYPWAGAVICTEDAAGNVHLKGNVTWHHSGGI